MARLKPATLLLITFLTTFFHAAQSSNSWQQEVNYRIDVRLNDKNHSLKGFVQMEYINHSPDTLSEILIHLWPNAYANRKTPFAKQQIANNATDFHYADENEMGKIDQLNFIVNNKAGNWEIDSNSRELAIIKLDKPLLPGAEVKIGTPFEVEIPGPFSRFGHSGQNYQITQWYPKPAVYNHNGWHPMPYLDQGEFYSEFGNFDVRITVPKNYVIAASGTLQSEEEKAWLSERAEWSSSIANAEEWPKETPASDEESKTVNFVLENAHDFAWFASKRYLVAQRSIQFSGKKDSVLLQSFYLPEERSTWYQAIDFVEKGLRFYNDKVGTYGYSTCTAVNGFFGPGGGMEYPSITVIGPDQGNFSLERVIVHEIGHNWFYAMLANNERKDPWLDESINSYYETRYIEENYPDKKLVNDFPRLANFFGLRDFDYSYQNLLFYLFTARQNQSQPIDLHSTEFSVLNYGAIVYGKGALAFKYLSEYLGESRFDSIMQAYFQTYRFRHHHPEDLQEFLENASNKNTNWFFEELLAKDQRIDFKISKVKSSDDQLTVRLKNRSSFSGPLPLQQYEKDSLLSEKWIPGFQNDTSIQLANRNARTLHIDRRHFIPEFQSQNNHYRLRGVANKIEKIRIQFLGSIDHPEKTELYFFPVYSWNNYDKSMLGFAFYNHTLLNKKFEFELLPLFSTATLNFSGTGNMNYNWWPKSGKVREWKLGMSASRFSYLLFPEVQRFHKANPYLKISFKKKDVNSPINMALKLRSVQIWQDYLIPETDNGHFYTNEAAFEIDNTNPLFPWEWETTFRQGETFGSIQSTFNFDIPYRQGREAVKFRFFAGGFLWNNKAPGAIAPPNPRLQLSGSTGSGSAALLPIQGDYLFDHRFLDRNGFDPVFGQQIVTKDGGFKSRTIIGDTDRFLSSVIVESTFPGKIPIKPYAGFAAFIDRGDDFDIAAELGISIVILPEIFEIHLPIVTSNNIKENQETGSLGLDKYYEKITFTLNITKANPFKQIKNLSF